MESYLKRSRFIGPVVPPDIRMMPAPHGFHPYAAPRRTILQLPSLKPYDRAAHYVRHDTELLRLKDNDNRDEFAVLEVVEVESSSVSRSVRSEDYRRETEEYGRRETSHYDRNSLIGTKRKFPLQEDEYPQETERRSWNNNHGSQNSPRDEYCDHGMGKSGNRLRMPTKMEVMHFTKSDPRYIDTHCHLDYMRYMPGLRSRNKSHGGRGPHFHTWDDLLDLFSDMCPANFDGFIWNLVRPTNMKTCKRWIDEWSENPRLLGITVGCHPHYAEEYYVHEKYSHEGMKNYIDELLKDNADPESRWYKRVVAIGECGIDMIKDSPLEAQLWVFQNQLKLAKEHDLPVVIHCRGGVRYEKICVEMIKETLGVFHPIHKHCFDGDVDSFALWSTLKNVKFGITPMIFNMSEESLKLIESISIHNIILETDAPFFPTPTFANDQTTMSYPPQAITVACALSQLYSMAVRDVFTVTTRNARSLYNLHK